MPMLVGWKWPSGSNGKVGCLELSEYEECGDLNECHFEFDSDRVTV